MTNNTTTCNEIILFDDAYLTSLIADIEKAVHSIDFEVYIFDNDVAGKILSTALCAAAERGVTIRVLVDGVGSSDWGNEMTIKMVAAGIATRIYHPVLFFIRQWHSAVHAPGSILPKMMYWLSRINSRDHRKVCIIDNNIVYISSANITNHLLKEMGEDNLWRETTIKLCGENIDELKYAFDIAWSHVPFKKRIRSVIAKINPEPIFRLNYSWRRKRALSKSLLSRIANCKKRIWVTNAYFVPDNHLLKALLKASKNGIHVSILLPNKSDVLVSSLATKTFYSVLYKNGVSIYEYLPRTLHAKVLILDDWCIVGSSNLNYRSIKHDLEVDVCIRTKEAKTKLDEQFLADLGHSKKISFDDVNNQPGCQYFLGRVILFIRYWL